MKKQTGAISFLTVLCFLFITWLPCQAADNLIYGCKNNKTGTPRFVSDPLKCKKTEYLVTLHGTLDNSTQTGQLSCVTGMLGQDEDNDFELSLEISYQKNISVSVPSEVFEIWKDDVNQEGGYKFGASCKNEWIMVSCTQQSGDPSYDIDIKQDIGCARDRSLFHDHAKLYATCCKIM